MKNDDRRAFYQRVEAEQQDIISVLKSVVSIWTEKYLAINEPIFIFEHFIDEHPEWDHDEFYATIGEEMKRVIIHASAEREHLPRTSKVI